MLMEFLVADETIGSLTVHGGEGELAHDVIEVYRTQITSMG